MLLKIWTIDLTPNPNSIIKKQKWRLPHASEDLDHRPNTQSQFNFNNSKNEDFFMRLKIWTIDLTNIQSQYNYKNSRNQDFFMRLKLSTFDLTPNLYTSVLSATEREIAILRKVTSDRKLELADQYVIYSDGAAICRPTDRRRVFTTFVEPSLPVGDGWHMGLPLGPIFYLLLEPREFRGVGVTSRPFARYHGAYLETSMNRYRLGIG
jgi:hypothetical protein